MAISDTILTLFTPIIPIIAAYLVYYYVNIWGSRNMVLKMISEVSSTLREFKRTLRGTPDTKTALIIAGVNVSIIYAALLLIFVYPLNQNLYFIPIILLFIVEIEFILAARYAKKKETELVAIDLRTYGNIQATVSILSWFVIIVDNAVHMYATSPQNVFSYVLGTSIIALIFSAATIYLTQLLKSGDLENRIFRSRFANKIEIEVITPRMKYAGKITGIGQFLNLKNSKKTQIIKWHDIKEIAFIKESV